MPADDDNTVRFQSTLPARGATRIKPLHRVGVEISIHAPRTGSDHGKMAKQGECFPFQSTLPARGATLSLLATFLPETNFNPRSPHGERRCCRFCTPSIPRFQSTLPARGATRLHRRERRLLLISIHAPRTGSDRAARFTRAVSPLFQSTLPARGATLTKFAALFRRGISIHAPRTGSDACYFVVRRRESDFNPRSPHGERPRPPIALCRPCVISIHAPRTGSDIEDAFTLVAPPEFQSTLPARGATHPSLQ